MSQSDVTHKFLDCGIELVALPLPDRTTVSGEFRFLAGFVNEPEALLGVNHILEQTISKGTSQFDGRGLSDAFDAIGARWSSYAGRESTGYQLTCLPEFLQRTVTLHGEYLRRPTFPEEAVQVSIENTLQDIANIEDDPDDLSAKLFNRQVYGPILGRHVLGELETVRSLTRDDVLQYYRKHYTTGRMQVSFAGAFDIADLEKLLNDTFGDFGDASAVGRDTVPYTFEPVTCHHDKELEQEHIGICYPGADMSDEQRYAQRVAMGVLSGGMSARLFTEVREKQGLVYWVTAWTEHPRGVGIVYLGASTTPERCEKTFNTLLREVDRLEEDLSEDEVQRAIKGIVAKMETRGDITRARRGELADDLFHHGKVLPREEKIARIQRVSVADVRAYLRGFPRDRLSVFTLGPRKLSA